MPKENQLMFEPYNQAHSISEMVAYVQFGRGFTSEEIDGFVQLKEELSDYFEIKKNIEGHTFEVGISNQEENESVKVSKSLEGIELQSKNDDERLIWALKTSKDVISLHCLDYSSWDFVIERIVTVLEAATKRIFIQGDHEVKVGLQYIDRYVSKKKSSDSDITDLIKLDSGWLCSNLNNSVNNLFHSDVGIFTNLEGYMCLNNVKISGYKKQPSDDSKLIVDIIHQGIFHEVKCSSLNFLDAYNLLHTNNKKTLNEILQESMLKQINI